jgi:prepilin-type processing-associated H-X9-DG protein
MTDVTMESPYDPLPWEKFDYGVVPSQLVVFDSGRWINAEVATSAGGRGGEWGTAGYAAGYDKDITWGTDEFTWVEGGPYLGNGGSTTIFQLREGIERFMITDINNPGASAMAQSTLAAMSDNISLYLDRYNHVPGGANVLYMDGHVKFVKYPNNEFPVNKGFARFMSRI